MKKFALIGQEMPKPPYPERPFGRTRLYEWLKSVDITPRFIEDYFSFSTLVSYFPGAKNGSHIVPSKQEILAEKPALKKFLTSSSPDVVVPIGKLSISECLQQKITSLNNIIGKKFYADPYGLLNKKLVIIPLPHPSGASTWFYKPQNKELIAKALLLIRQEITDTPKVVK